MASADPRRRPTRNAPPPPPPPLAEQEMQDVQDAQDARQVPDVQEVQVQASFTPPGSPPQAQDDDSFKLKFCTVCASNNNRSVPLLWPPLSALLIHFCTGPWKPPSNSPRTPFLSYPLEQAH